MVNLAIAYNNCASNDPCAICGGRTEPRIGLELFKAGTFEIVCWQCGEKHAPVLVKMLELHRAIEIEPIDLFGRAELDAIEESARIDEPTPMLSCQAEVDDIEDDDVITWFQHPVPPTKPACAGRWRRARKE